ncbi:hypothetical protein BH11MYX3_BH11MYX3_11090 [soil metagenome]
MRVPIWIAALFAMGQLASGEARAEHDHGGGHHHSAGTPSSFGAGVGLVVARYDTDVFIGDYQGVLPSVMWMRGRFGATANVGLYRLTENGARRYGFSDVVLSGQVTLLERHRALLGVALPVSLPTGDHATGFGMGHVMVMPALWASSSLRRVKLGASAGYGRAIGGGTAHDHGSWPLVDPMNLQELTWTASAYTPLGTELHAGVRMSGGVPIGAGRNRVTGGGRAIWTARSVETAFEIQAGFAGDPFILRGLVESAVHF